MIFKPLPHQPGAIQHIINNKFCALYAGCGLGKTPMVLMALEQIALTEEVYPILVLGPLRVARKVWDEETKKWEALSHLIVSKVIGNREERIRGLRIGADIYCMNYENLSWLYEFYGKDWPFKTVVADESTRLKSFRGSLQKSKLGKVFVRSGGGMRASQLAKVRPLIKRMIQLTGTPSPNGLKDLWGQLWFLDYGKRLGNTYGDFESRWFESLNNNVFGGTLVPRPGADEEIHALISDICYPIIAADWFDLEKPVVHTMLVDLPAPALVKYREMQNKLFTSIAGNEIEAVSAAAKSMKCLQLANGAAYIDEISTEWVTLHNEKLDALESIIEESGGSPIIVAYNFKSDLVRLKARFPQGRLLKTVKDEDDFKAGKIDLLFAHPESCGHGIDGFQKVCNIIVFFGLNWNLETHDQIIERIGPVRQMQSGMNRSMFVYYIAANKTIDQLVLERLRTKRSVQDILQQAIKLHQKEMK